MSTPTDAAMSEPIARGRVTAWHLSGALTGSWLPPAHALWVQQLYEYWFGVPTTVEYRRFNRRTPP